MIRQLSDVAVLKENKGVEYVAFTPFLDIDFICHGFSTKKGGVSKGCFASMNLSYERGDEKSDVDENFRRMGEAIGFDWKDCVLTNQWHTVNVRRIDEELKGQGITSNRVEEEIDGQITNVPGIPLVAYGADCCPIYFVDCDKKAIGLSHSGWKGTVNNISLHTIEMMCDCYGSNPKDIIAVVGPSICKDCYEIGADVAEAFMLEYYDDPVVEKGIREGKYQLDLWKANKINLLRAGVLPENIYVSGVCTKENSDLMFSHRRDGSNRGSMAAFLMLKD